MPTGTQKDRLLGVVQERLCQAFPRCKVLALLTPAFPIVLNYRLSHGLECKVKHSKTGNSAWLFLHDPHEVILVLASRFKSFSMALSCSCAFFGMPVSFD